MSNPLPDTGPLTLTVPASSVGLSVATVLHMYAGAAATLWLERGGVWLAGQRVVDPDLPVPSGTVLTIHLPPNGRYTDITIVPDDICYEDDWLIALYKRAGWYSGATPWDVQGNVLAALRHFLAARDGVAPPLHLAHQLDRDTSGVLLVSKSPQANAPLQAAFASGSLEKTYHAVCQGEPADAFEQRSGHGRAAAGRWRIYPLDHVGMALPGGGRVRLAHTSFTCVQRLNGAALLQAIPHTGRTHQIRLHLAALGHPLLGDTRYGGPASFAGLHLSGHLLHATRLQLQHPITGQLLDLSAPWPDQICAVLAAATNSDPNPA